MRYKLTKINVLFIFKFSGGLAAELWPSEQGQK